MSNLEENLVALTPCTEYEADRIKEILISQMEATGAINEIREGMRVALKLNLVSAMKPDTAGTTHPAVIEALCSILIERGASVVLGDSPGGPFNSTLLKTVYNVCGITQIAEKTGAELNMDFGTSNVIFHDGVIAKNITVTSWLLNADIIINCCKLKTHGMMAMSAAVKNMFGSIPGTMKPEYHFRFPNQEDFANMIIDLQEYWKPKMLMHVVDGIVGMEGNGPTAGTPRGIGILMSGADPYALDLVGGRIIGLETSDVMTMSLAYERGLAKGSADEVTLLMGNKRLMATVENLKPYMIEDYELMDNSADIQFGGNSFWAKLRRGVMKKFLSSRPEVNRDECIGCRKCEQICPAKAITMENNIPTIDRSKCIKCFCCQEFCPKGAMKVKRTAIAKLLTH